MKILKFICPLRVEVGRKSYTINLNQYRNWHYIIESKVKAKYKSIIYSQIMSHNKLVINKCRLNLRLYKSSTRQRDKSNFLCIHEKYFCDALVENNLMIDDSDNYILSTCYQESVVDKNNPRVEIEIIVLG